MLPDIIADIATQQAAEIAVTFAFAAAGAAGTFALAQLSRWMGEKRIAILREMLTPAIDRAIAQARAKGLSEASVHEWAVAYIKRTMGGTIKKLKIGRAHV